MTERFTVDKFIEDYKSHIIDNEGEIETLSEFVEYLNNLTNQYDNSKKRYTVGDELRVVDDNILKGTFYVCVDRVEALKVADKLNEFYNENVRLNRENEQLKQKIKLLRMLSGADKE